MKRKIFTLFLAGCMMLGAAACGKGNEERSAEQPAAEEEPMQDAEDTEEAQEAEVQDAEDTEEAQAAEDVEEDLEDFEPVSGSHDPVTLKAAGTSVTISRSTILYPDPAYEDLHIWDQDMPNRAIWHIPIAGYSAIFVLDPDVSVDSFMAGAEEEWREKEEYRQNNEYMQNVEYRISDSYMLETDIGQVSVRYYYRYNTETKLDGGAPVLYAAAPLSDKVTLCYTNSGAALAGQEMDADVRDTVMKSVTEGVPLSDEDRKRYEEVLKDMIDGEVKEVFSYCSVDN